jgi:hypothetical protein
MSDTDVVAAERGIVPIVQQMLERLEGLVGDHVALAKVELADKAVGLRRRAIWLTASISLATVGLAGVCGAATFFLAPVLGTGGALLAVGVLGLGVGVVGVRQTTRA